MSSTHKALESKLKKIEEKNKLLQKKVKTLNGEKKYLKRRLKEISVGRASWKTKCRAKSLKVKVLRRELQIKSQPARHQYNLSVIVLSVCMRLVGGISYQAIVRILSFMLSKGEPVPCANTIQNWVSKMGYYKLVTDLDIDKAARYALILDESIRIGNEKMFMALLIAAENSTQEALNFQSTRVVCLAYAKSWTGDKIANELQAFRKQHPHIQLQYLLGDEDGKLKKAARCLDLPYIADISHSIATCLRHSFGQDAAYQEFCKLVASYQAKGVNSELSYLLPPKQRSKARFMNQYHLIAWAAQLMAKYKLLNQKEQAFFQDLAQHQSLIEAMSSCLAVAQKVALWLKKEGYSLEKASFITQEIAPLTQSKNASIACFANKLLQYLEKYANFAKQANPKSSYQVCSDIIESLFGKYKSLLSDNAWVGSSVIGLELGLYTLDKKQIEDKIQDALEQVFISDIDSWKEDYKADNQHVKRNIFFKNQHYN